MLNPIDRLKERLSEAEEAHREHLENHPDPNSQAEWFTWVRRGKKLNEALFAARVALIRLEEQAK